MRILIITPSCPYPPHKSGGALIIYNLLRQNSNDNIDLLYYDEYDEKAESVIKKHVDNLYNKDLKLRTKCKDRILSIMKRIPYGLYQYKYSLFKKYFHILTQNEYDVVFFDQFSSVLFSDMVKCDKKIFFECDCISLYYYRKFKVNSKNILEKLYNNLQYRYYRRIEKNYYNKFAKVFFVSEADELYVKNNFSKDYDNIDHINLGVDIEHFNAQNYNNVKLKDNIIIFTGIMSYSPNKNAAIYFCENILPDLVKAYPDLKFYIVGKNPDNEIKQLQNRNIIVTGFVDDIAEYIAKATVYVSPLKYGTGMKNKILEAMSMNKPIVASSVSVEGINELKDGENIFIANTNEEWKSKILKLLSSKDIRQKIGDKGRTIVIKNYSWKKAYDKLFYS